MILFLDFDGTLHHSDLMWEQFLRTALRKPQALVPLLSESLQTGIPGIKRQLAKGMAETSINLPWNEELLAFARSENSKFTRIVVATAGDEEAVRLSLANHGYGWEVIGTRDGRNLKGAEKLKAMAALAGRSDFCYIGDSSVDLNVWIGASRIGFVGRTQDKARYERALGRTFDYFFHYNSRIFSAIPRTLRPIL